MKIKIFSCSKHKECDKEKFSVKTNRVLQKIAKWFQDLCKKFQRSDGHDECKD